MRPNPTIFAAFVAIIFGGGPVACDRSAPIAPSKMSIEEIIRQNANAPVGQSVIPIASSLAKHSVFVATESAPSTQPTTVILDKLRFRTAQDNEGRTWAYAYTNQAELLAHFHRVSHMSSSASKISSRLLIATVSSQAFS